MYAYSEEYGEKKEATNNNKFEGKILMIIFFRRLPAAAERVYKLHASVLRFALCVCVRTLCINLAQMK